MIKSVCLVSCFISASVLASCTSSSPTPSLNVSCKAESPRDGMVIVEIKGTGLSQDTGYTITAPDEEFEQLPSNEVGSIEAAFDTSDRLIAKRQFTRDGTLRADHLIKGNRSDEVKVSFEREAEVVAAVCD